MNNPIIKKTILYLITLSVLIMAAVSCGLFSSGKIKVGDKGLVRLLDELDTNNLVQSPFEGLIDHFPPVEEKFSINDAVMIRELSTSREKVWAVTTERSILGKDESRRPDEMEVNLGGKKVDYLGREDTEKIRWQWVKTGRDIDIRFDENYNRGLNCLVLDEDQSFVFDSFLPNAPVTLEVRARRNWHPLNLNIYLDGEKIGSRAAGRMMTSFRMEIPAAPGTRSLSLKPEVKETIAKQKPTPPRLLIYRVRIITKNDAVMFFVPQSLADTFSKNSIAVRYYSELKKNKEINPYANIYRIKHDFTLDSHSQPINPVNVKKEIALENLSLKVLMSPPLSRYEYRIKIPDDSRLEFGTGIFSYPEYTQQKDVQFIITAKHKDRTQILFDKVIRIEEGLLRKQLEFESIDLSRFSGESLVLSLITQPSSGDKSLQPENPAFSFWINPVIYRPEPEGMKVILISLDTLRADHLGSYGYERDTSPNIDQLAEDSVLFEDVYAHSPWTLPSHLSMLFSLNSASHQVYYNDQKIDTSFPSLASYLRKQGYLTRAFTGGGYVSSIYGFSKGFDGYEEPVGGRKAALQDDEAAYLYEKTSHWLNRNRDKKFFLFLHTFQTHGPYRCPPPWNKSFLSPEAKWNEMALRNFLDGHGDDYVFSEKERQNIIDLYDGEIKYTDEVLIKPLVAQLKEMGIYDNTLLIITSDHGEEFMDHGGWLHGRTLYNELIKVPLIIKFPSSRYKGNRVSSIVRLIDIMPTILDTAQVDYSGLDGKTLRELLSLSDPQDRTFISDLAHKNTPVPCPAITSTNRGRVKFIIDRSPDGVKSVEAYDLERDPEERQNIFHKVQEMRDEVVEFLQEYYEKKQKQTGSTERIQMGKELEEKLKALGYLR